MNSFGLLCCLIVGAFSLGTPVSSAAQDRTQSPSANSAKKLGKTAEAQGRARLKLEPLDLSIESDPQLKMSASLGEFSEASTAQRTQAAALWQALNTSPEDVQRSAQRGQALASDMDKLRAAVTRNKDQLTDLRQQLVQAQQSRTRWRYALWAVLAFSVLLVVLAWRRAVAQSQEPEWWKDSNSSFAQSGPSSSQQGRYPKAPSHEL